MFNYILKKLDRFLRTDTVYLAKGGFWLTIGRIVSMAISFALSIAYARYLMKDIYGDYRYILSIIGILGILALPGMGTALSRSVARGFYGTFRNCARIIFLSSIGISLLSLATSLFFFLKGNEPLALGFLAASFFVPFVEGLGSWRGYMDGRKQFKQKTAYNICSNLFYGIAMFGVVVAIYFLQMPFYVNVAALVGVHLISRAIPNLFFFRRAMQTVPQHSPQEPGAVRYGIHLSAISIPSTIATYIDGILLYSFLDPAALAVYSFALAPIEQLKGLFGTGANVALPKLSTKTCIESEKRLLKKTLPLKILKATFITGGIVLMYIIAAPYIYKIFFPRYLESTALSQVFAFSLILFPFGIFNTALKAEGNIRKIYIYNIGAPLIQIILLVILIPLFGLWGAIWGRLIGRLLNNLLPFVLFIR